MKNVLIVGGDSPLGSHLASEMAKSGNVLGLATFGSNAPRIARIAHLPHLNVAAARQLIQKDAIERVIYCGDAAQSCWFADNLPVSDTSNLSLWAQACESEQISLTMISSDGVFTGPWMFHDEANDCFCPSVRASGIREQENRVLSICSNALVVRTNAISWNTDEVLAASILDQGADSEMFAAVPHATPIYAGLFARLLTQILAANPKGILHVSGSERLSPYQLALQLSERFETATPRTQRVTGLDEAAGGFGKGETCLKSHRARHLLGRGLPSFSESLDAMEADIAAGLSESIAGSGANLVRVA